jgi:hypothetical protein
MPVFGGDKLKAYFNEAIKKSENAKRLQVGFLGDKNYEDGTSVAMVAMINEYGAPSRNQPPRPFFRNMIEKESGNWPKTVGALMKHNENDASKTLNTIGQDIAASLQDSIAETFSPALSPITVMLRGMRRNDPDLQVTGKTVGEAARRVKEGLTDYGASSKPLVDTNLMKTSVDYAVEE